MVILFHRQLRCDITPVYGRSHNLGPFRSSHIRLLNGVGLNCERSVPPILRADVDAFVNEHLLLITVFHVGFVHIHRCVFLFNNVDCVFDVTHALISPLPGVNILLFELLDLGLPWAYIPT